MRFPRSRDHSAIEGTVSNINERASTAFRMQRPKGLFVRLDHLRWRIRADDLNDEARCVRSAPAKTALRFILAFEHHRPHGRDRSALIVVLLAQLDQPMKSTSACAQPQHLKFAEIRAFDMRLFQSGSERMISQSGDFCCIGPACAGPDHCLDCKLELAGDLARSRPAGDGCGLAWGFGEVSAHKARLPEGLKANERPASEAPKGEAQGRGRSL
jgi:hypothetical protein